MEEIRVFLSSTSTDLQDERDAVSKAIRRMDLRVVGMEDFPAGDQSPIQVCAQSLAQCSIYVGIVGFRYGSVVPELELSFTEYEYGAASKAGLPRLVYLKSDRAMVRPADVEEDVRNRERLDSFKHRLTRAHLVGYFVNAWELAALVAADLHLLLSGRSARTTLVAETDLLQAPRIMIKRAEMALSTAIRFFKQTNAVENNGRLTRDQAQATGLEFLRDYRFRFDGQFSVFDSQCTTVYHDYNYMVGQPFPFIPLDISPVFESLENADGYGQLKWIDNYSSDYLLVDDAFYPRGADEGWLRFNIAPFAYFAPWDWWVTVEAHNEVHGLERRSVESILEEFRRKGWPIL